jgi:hypothetical protein
VNIVKLLRVFLFISLAISVAESELRLFVNDDTSSDVRKRRLIITVRYSECSRDLSMNASCDNDLYLFTRRGRTED